MRRKAIDLCETIIPQAIQQIGYVLKEDRLWQLQSTAAPAEWKGWQDPDTGRIAQLVSEQAQGYIQSRVVGSMEYHVVVPQQHPK